MNEALSFRNLDNWDPAPFIDDLAKGGYTADALPGIAKFGGTGHVLRATPDSPAQESLIRLFLAGETIASDNARAALPNSYTSLIKLALLTEDHGMTGSTLRIRPVNQEYCAEDFPRLLEFDATESPEFVMGVAPTTRMLRRIIPNVPRHDVLDLCCGGGWLAIKEAINGAKVIGTDLSKRCLEVARLNARLAGARELDWRCGPWFSPVDGETFDLIVSNPPFVQSPGGKSMALDTPAEEDPVTVLLSNLKQHLNPGGFACLLLNWQYQDPEHWEKFPLACLPDQGLQIVLFELQRHDPKSYALHWLQQDVRFKDESKQEAEAKRWATFLQERGSAGVSSGFLVVRRCEPGQEWTHTESREAGYFSPQTGEELARVFRNQSWLHNYPKDRSILDESFQPVPGVRQHSSSLLVDGEWKADTIRLQSPGQLMYDGHVDEALLKILEEASRGIPVRNCLPDIAKLAGATQVEQVEGGVENLLSELVARGLLDPPPAS